MIETSIPTTPPAIEQLEDQPNLLMGLIGGGIAMLVSAIAWGAITYFTEYQIGWMAVGLGFLVGAAIRYLGKGKTLVFGISGAVLALVGCLLGNLIFYSGAIARMEGTSFVDIFFWLLLNPLTIIEVFTTAFEFMDVFFYALAAYAGFSAAMDVKGTKK